MGETTDPSPTPNIYSTALTVMQQNFFFRYVFLGKGVFRGIPGHFHKRATAGGPSPEGVASAWRYPGRSGLSRATPRPAPSLLNGDAADKHAKIARRDGVCAVEVFRIPEVRDHVHDRVVFLEP